MTAPIEFARIEEVNRLAARVQDHHDKLNTQQAAIDRISFQQDQMCNQLSATRQEIVGIIRDEKSRSKEFQIGVKDAVGKLSERVDILIGDKKQSDGAKKMVAFLVDAIKFLILVGGVMWAIGIGLHDWGARDKEAVLTHKNNAGENGK